MLIVGDDQFSFRQLFFCIQHVNSFGAFRYAVIRDEGDSKSDACKIYEQIVAGKFDLGDQIKLMLLKELMEKFVRSTVFIKHQYGISDKLAESKFSAAQLLKSVSGYEYISEAFYLDDG